MTDQEITQFAKKLMDAGVRLNATYEPIGCEFGLRPSDLVAYLQDRDAFFAAECGLEKDEYVAWKAFMKAGRPCAHHGGRAPCPRPAKASAGLSPQEFARRRVEGSLLCSRHMAGKDRGREA